MSGKPPRPSQIAWTSALHVQVDDRYRIFMISENQYGCWATEEGSQIVGFGENPTDAIANYLQQEK